MDKAKRSFNTGKELKMLRGGGGGAEILGVFWGDLKNRGGQGEGVKSGYRAKGRAGLQRSPHLS